MAKILITGDIHLADYRNHNIFGTSFRLNQFDVLADRIISIVQENIDIEGFVIAGDFLHVASPRPYVVNTAFSFLDKISSWVPVYLTHGQHDIDTRRADIENNTLLTLSNLISNVTYLHKESTSIGKARFYFLGWVPNTEEELEYVDTDVLIGHFQPGTVSVGQRNFLLSGGKNVPNNPGWKIAFVGDIHTHQIAKGNIVIPGVPIQHSFNDPIDTGFILFDTETFEWERIPTQVPGQWDFLQFLITDDVIETDWVVTRPKTITSTKKVQQIVDKRLDVGETIENFVTQHNLMPIHTEILSYVPNSIRQEVDLNFTLEKVEIHDFRSIHHFEWDNIGEGVKLLFGNNGTGKSSLVTALIFALSGEGSGRTLTRKGCNNMYVEVTLLYGRNRHTIRRGWSSSGKLRYWINNAEQQAENQRGLLEKIEENLPFLRFVDLMYHQQDRPGFLSSYNYSARVDLISRVLGLQIVDALYEESKRQLVDIDRQLANIRAKMATVNAIVEQESFVDFTFKEIVNDDKEAHLKILRDDIKALIQEERRKHDEYTREKTSLTHSIERETCEIAQIEQHQKTLQTQICYTCGQHIRDDVQSSLLEKSNEKMFLKREQISKWSEHLGKLTECSSSVLEKLERRLENVITTISEIDSMRCHQTNLLQLKSRIESSKMELITLQNDYTHLSTKRERLDEYKTLLAPAGPIMRTLLVTLSDIFSSDVVKVRAHKQLVNGEIRPDFTVDINVSGDWIEYDSASGGQKTVADMIVFEKLLQLSGGLGLVVFDETFKFLDNENLEKTIDVLKQISCSNIFVVSHVENFPYFDTSIQTTTNDDHTTHYIIR